MNECSLIVEWRQDWIYVGNTKLRDGGPNVLQISYGGDLRFFVMMLAGIGWTK